MQYTRVGNISEDPFFVFVSLFASLLVPVASVAFPAPTTEDEEEEGEEEEGEEEDEDEVEGEELRPLHCPNA